MLFSSSLVVFSSKPSTQTNSLSDEVVLVIFIFIISWDHGCWSSAGQFERQGHVRVTPGRILIGDVINMATGFLAVMLHFIIFQNQWRLLAVVNNRYHAPNL